MNDFDTPPTTPMRETMQKKLEDAFSPQHLDIVDESYLHEGHPGVSHLSFSKETHFAVTIKASSLEDKTPIEQHRDVYRVLSEEVPFIHALRIEIL